VAGAGDGDVSEAGVEQVRVNTGIGIDQDALGGEALGAVAGHGVAMIEKLCHLRLPITLNSTDPVIDRVQAPEVAKVGKHRFTHPKNSLSVESKLRL
jgi:hypothetical protein